MEQTYIEERPSQIVTMSVRQMLQVFLVGLLVGCVIWGVTFLFEKYILGAVLCKGQVSCSPAGQYASVFAAILSMAVGLAILVKLQIFRPLLIVIAAAVCLWGAFSIVSKLQWYEAMLFCAALYALAYATFAWIARVRLFSFSLLVTFVLTVIVRFILVA